MNYLQNKKRLFWVFNISGWFLYYLLVQFLFYSNSLHDIHSVLGVGITYATGFLISICLRIIYRKIGFKGRSILLTAVWIVVVSAIISHIWYYIDITLSYWIINADFLFLRNFTTIESYVFSRITVCIAWSGFYYIYYLWCDWNNEKQRAERANLLAHKAQLQMLRYQLNPHFLFNALNTVRALIEEDKDTAKSVITELSEFLRYSLISKNYTDVPFSNELEAIKHYFEIQKIRYENKLDVTYEIEPGVESFPVLSFLIYPLIENAVKYGMQTSSLPLKLIVRSKIASGNLIIEITNSGKWVKEKNIFTPYEEGTGTGIENVKQRLENAYGDNHSFKIIEQNDTVTIQIEIRK